MKTSNTYYLIEIIPTNPNPDTLYFVNKDDIEPTFMTFPDYSCRFNDLYSAIKSLNSLVSMKCSFTTKFWKISNYSLRIVKIIETQEIEIVDINTPECIKHRQSIALDKLNHDDLEPLEMYFKGKINV